MRFHRIIIVGCGQIGASIGFNLMGQRLAPAVIGVDTNRKNLLLALKQKSAGKIFQVRSVSDILRLKFSERDLVVLATPVLMIQEYLNVLPRGPLLMDVGSTKRKILAIAEKRRLRFVGAHPMAGTEREGAVAAKKELFRDRVCLITPARGIKKGDRKIIERIWSLMGSRVFRIDSRIHDAVLAFISHLPHVVAFSLMQAAIKKLPLASIARFSGEGFRDTTRIAASSAEMWGDIFIGNSGKILEALEQFQKSLGILRSMIQKGKRNELRKWLRKISWMRKRLNAHADR